MFSWYRESSSKERKTFWACFGGWGLDALDVQMFAHVFHQGLPLVAERRYAPHYDASLAQYLDAPFIGLDNYRHVLFDEDNALRSGFSNALFTAFLVISLNITR